MELGPNPEYIPHPRFGIGIVINEDMGWWKDARMHRMEVCLLYIYFLMLIELIN